MKRDMDLIRKILIKLEDTPEPRNEKNFTFDGFSHEQISYHVMLLDEAGLIEAINFSSSNGFSWTPRRLTWIGHEFIEASRDDSRWEKALNMMKEKGGGMAFDVLKIVLIQLMTKAVLS